MIKKCCNRKDQYLDTLKSELPMNILVEQYGYPFYHSLGSKGGKKEGSNREDNSVLASAPSKL